MAISKKRNFFSKNANEAAIELDLLSFQKESYQRFIEKDFEKILTEFFPIEDYTKKNWLLTLDKVEYQSPKISVDEAFDKQLSYSFPVYLHLELQNRQ
ncbi:hypothetical protein COU89_00335, partial [Candidatus Roizmanbacteria bacterium CG10_big_fil_rev_8_21_14_0_10_45_7]